MKRFGFLLFLLGLHEISFAQTLKSPNGRFDLQFAINAEGRPTYQLKFDGKDVVKTSGLGLELKKEKADKQETFDNSQHTDASTIDVKADMMYGFQLKDQQFRRDMETRMGRRERNPQSLQRIDGSVVSAQERPRDGASLPSVR